MKRVQRAVVGRVTQIEFYLCEKVSGFKHGGTTESRVVLKIVRWLWWNMTEKSRRNEANALKEQALAVQIFTVSFFLRQVSFHGCDRNRLGACWLRRVLH